jgi:hypothetical protein
VLLANGERVALPLHPQEKWETDFRVDRLSSPWATLLLVGATVRSQYHFGQVPCGARFSESFGVGVGPWSLGCS